MSSHCFTILKPYKWAVIKMWFQNSKIYSSWYKTINKFSYFKKCTGSIQFTWQIIYMRFPCVSSILTPKHLTLSFAKSILRLNLYFRFIEIPIQFFFTLNEILFASSQFTWFFRSIFTSFSFLINYLNITI